MSSKEIAIETGLSPQTVDQYLARAASALGVSNRRDAARRFAELSDAERFNKSEFRPAAVANDTESGTILPSVQRDMPVSIRERIARLFPSVGGQKHDLNTSEVIQAVLRLSLLTTGAAAAIIGIVLWLNRLAV